MVGILLFIRMLAGSIFNNSVNFLKQFYSYVAQDAFNMLTIFKLNLNF